MIVPVPPAAQRVVVKVCGVTDERDAVDAALLGVDAVGFHFQASSPRFVEPARARRIAEKLPVLVAKVGVFADEPLIRVLEVARTVGLTAVQLNGSEPPAYCASLTPLGWYKGLHVGEGFSPETLGRYGCTTFLLDASGIANFDWGRVRDLSVYGRLLVSGGIGPENVTEVLCLSRPYGVDVCEGVEFVPGKMDIDRLESLVETVRSWRG